MIWIILFNCQWQCLLYRMHVSWSGFGKHGAKPAFFFLLKLFLSSHLAQICMLLESDLIFTRGLNWSKYGVAHATILWYSCHNHINVWHMLMTIACLCLLSGWEGTRQRTRARQRKGTRPGRPKEIIRPYICWRPPHCLYRIFFFFFLEGTFCEFPCFCSIKFFLILYIKILFEEDKPDSVYYCSIGNRVSFICTWLNKVSLHGNMYSPCVH